MRGKSVGTTVITGRRLRHNFLAAAIVAVAALATLFGVATGASKTSTESGKFTYTLSDCNPVCTQGSLSGDLKGTFELKGITGLPVDPSTTWPPGILFYTGEMAIELKDGSTLTCKDAGVLSPRDLVSVCIVVDGSGTGSFADAFRTIRFSGTFTQDVGGQGTYESATLGL